MTKAVSKDPAEFASVSHEILFEEVQETCCDACGRDLRSVGKPEGYDPPGSGAYLWKRGDHIVIERPPLCRSCASAIGMTALARWEIEEEEG